MRKSFSRPPPFAPILHKMEKGRKFLRETRRGIKTRWQGRGEEERGFRSLHGIKWFIALFPFLRRGKNAVWHSDNRSSYRARIFLSSFLSLSLSLASPMPFVPFPPPLSQSPRDRRRGDTDTNLVQLEKRISRASNKLFFQLSDVAKYPIPLAWCICSDFDAYSNSVGVCSPERD